MSREEWLRFAQTEGKMCISEDLFADLFPPGIPDQGAMEQAIAWAAENGMKITRSGGEVCLEPM